MAGSTSAQAPVDICNLSLGKLGAKRISSITGGDSSEEAAACANCYYDMVDEVLGKAPWTFAQKRINLSQLSVTLPYTTDGMTVAYAKPSDFLKINYKSSRWARITVEGVWILSNVSGLGVKYTFKNYTVSQYFSEFKSALSTRIASEICFRLTNSVKKAQDIMKEYEEIRLPEAISSDSQQGTPDPAIADEWDSARLVGDVTLIGQTGQDVWFPVN